MRRSPIKVRNISQLNNEQCARHKKKEHGYLTSLKLFLIRENIETASPGQSDIFENYT